MKYRVFGTLLALAVAAAPASADTITLRNGATIDGRIISRSGGIIKMQTGSRTVAYRENEIVSTEENQKTGHFDRAAAEARVAARDKDLEERTGLAREQRKEVRALLYQLQNSERGVREGARARLVAMQQQYDIYPFLALSFAELSHRLSPWVLQALYYVDAKRGVAMLRENLTHNHFGTRAMAITLLGEAGDRSSSGEIARGLADAMPSVQFAAMEALTLLGYHEMTPALLELAESPDVTLSGAAIKSLQTLWADQVGAEVPADVAAWKEFWRGRATRYRNAVMLANLEPLIDPSEEFMDE